MPSDIYIFFVIDGYSLQFIYFGKTFHFQGELIY